MPTYMLSDQRAHCALNPQTGWNTLGCSVCSQSADKQVVHTGCVLDGLGDWSVRCKCLLHVTETVVMHSAAHLCWRLQMCQQLAVLIKQHNTHCGSKNKMPCCACCLSLNSVEQHSPLQNAARQERQLHSPAVHIMHGQNPLTKLSSEVCELHILGSHCTTTMRVFETKGQ